MTVLLEKNGQRKCPDWPKLVESLTPAQIKFFGPVLEDVIANKDSTVILEFYAALANHHKFKMTRAEKKEGAEEAEHRFFSVEAYENDEASRRAAHETIERAEDAGLLLLGGNDGPERSM